MRVRPTPAPDPSFLSLPFLQQAVKNMKPVDRAVAQLASIRETSVCNYTLTVCTPLLCHDDVVEATMTPSLTGAAGGCRFAKLHCIAMGARPCMNSVLRTTHTYTHRRTANSAVLRLLEPLRDFCLTRHEGYWSYEFCYKRGIRQYHNVAVRDPKGACHPRWRKDGLGLEVMHHSFLHVPHHKHMYKTHRQDGVQGGKRVRDRAGAPDVRGRVPGGEPHRAGGGQWQEEGIAGAF